MSDTALSEEEIACGMLGRYRTVAIATKMATWHAMDYPVGSENRARWLRIRATIERLNKETKETRP